MNDVTIGCSYEKYSHSQLMAEKTIVGQPRDVGSMYGAAAMPYLSRRDNAIKEIRGYQTINISTPGLSIVETAGSYFMTGLVALPSFYGTHFEIQPDFKKIRQQEDLAEGYRAMAEENCFLAEDSISIAREVWPDWEE